MVPSAVGIYGVLSYLVAQRRREIGIRMALGSTQAAIFRLFLRQGIVLVGTGLVLGLAGAAALRRAVENQIYGVHAARSVGLGDSHNAPGGGGARRVLVACTPGYENQSGDRAQRVIEPRLPINCRRARALYFEDENEDDVYHAQRPPSCVEKRNALYRS